MENSTLDQLMDFDLSFGQDFQLDEVNDLQIVTGKKAVLWGLIRRMFIVRGSWAYNPNIGTGLKDMLRSRGTRTITEKEIEDLVREAAAPMIQEGRISEVDYVRITERTKKGITIEIAVIITDSTETVELEVPLL